MRVSNVFISFLFLLLGLLSASIFLPSPNIISTTIKRLFSGRSAISPLPIAMTSEAEWCKALDELPSTPNKIPAFFFSHGSPFLAFPEEQVRSGAYGGMGDYMGPTGPLGRFLKIFGPALMKKYEPKGIVVFSAHWETIGERVVTDYGDENPLLMDYYGFQPELYRLNFKSKGNAELSRRVVELYSQAGMKARTTSREEARGEDGRGFAGPGLDHGVFVPFRLMFGEEMEIPVVQVSIDSSLSPEKNWAIGKAVSQLREEGILVLSGGLTMHNLRDRSSFVPATASEAHKSFDAAVVAAVREEEPGVRRKAMEALTRHPGFRASHPREEHFVPLYVAAGAGDGDGEVRVLSSTYGTPTFAFGV